MTFKEFLKQKKDIDTDKFDPMELMDEYYDEYKQFLAGVKDGCTNTNAQRIVTLSGSRRL